MADLTVPRKTPRRNSAYDMKWDFVAAIAIYHGTFVAIDASGTLVNAADASSKCVGRAHCANGVSAAIDERVRVDQGIFCWDHSTLAADDIGNTVFAVDNHTVAATGTIAAGVLVDVDAEGAWVRTELGIGAELAT